MDLDKESERKYTNQTLEYRYMKERGLLQNEILSYQFHCKIVNPIMITPLKTYQIDETDIKGLVKSLFDYIKPNMITIKAI